jgi:hypothetical protein
VSYLETLALLSFTLEVVFWLLQEPKTLKKQGRSRDLTNASSGLNLFDKLAAHDPLL